VILCHQDHQRWILRKANRMGIRDIARSLGYLSDNIELNFVLDLPVPEPKLAELEHWARERSRGYQAVTWSGLPPAAWREKYTTMITLSELDYPPEDRDPMPWTTERIELLLHNEIKQGRNLITTLIMDSSSAPAAFTTLWVTNAPHEWASQGTTAVLNAHRGHRLAMLAKVANVRRLAADFPQTHQLHTEVSVDNELMWAINDRFGFCPRT